MMVVTVRLVFVVVTVLGWISKGSAQDLAVSNRAPGVNEVVYKPAEGETVAVNPPGFVWLPEEGADGYILQCAKNPDFMIYSYEKREIELNVHCPDRTFSPGKWYWRYTFVTKDGKQAEWSVVRSFTIPDDAVRFPKPTIDDLVERLPDGHPKLFLRPEQVKTFRDEIETNHPELWKRFIANVNDMLDDEVATEEPAPYPEGRRGTSKENIDLWRKNRNITVNAVDHAANLAFAYLLTGEARYGEKAKEWIMAVVSWPPDGTTSYRYNDECGMPILSCIPRAYTWVHHLMTEEEKEKIAAVMAVRGREVYEYLRYQRHHTVSPYESHRNRAWHFMSETAIGFIDDIPEAKQWLDYAMDIFYNVYPVWNDDDGGWHEGVAYMNSYITRITWWLDIIQAAFGIDGYKKPYFKNSGDFPFYVMPPDAEFGGFGDGADTSRPHHLAPLMRLLADRVKNPYWMWYADRAEPYEAPSKPDYLDLLRTPKHDVKAMPPTDVETMKVFHGAGIASIHSDLDHPDRDNHFLFKSSPFGTQSHGFNAQNSFIMSVFGKPVLLWSGHRDWHGSEHHTKWMWETWSDNSITVNGIGQIKHSPNARGKIVSEFNNEHISFVAGDASEAYGEHLDKFIRNVVFIKPGLFFVIDELEAPKPSTFQYHLHANEKFDIRNHQYEIMAYNGNSAVKIGFAAPSELRIEQASGHIPPSVGFEQEQWHLTAETQRVDDRVCFLTLMNAQAKTVMQVQYQIDRGLTKEEPKKEVYTLVVGKWISMVVMNPERESYQFGGLRTDAAYLVMTNYDNKADTAFLFAIDAGKVVQSDETIFSSENRDNYFVRWKDLELEREMRKIKEKAADTNEQSPESAPNPNG